MNTIEFAVEVFPSPVLDNYIKQVNTRFEDPLIQRFLTQKIELRGDILLFRMKHFIPIFWQFGLLFIIPLLLLYPILIDYLGIWYHLTIIVSGLIMGLAYLITVPYFHYMLMRHGVRKYGYKLKFRWSKWDKEKYMTF